MKAFKDALGLGKELFYDTISDKDKEQQARTAKPPDNNCRASILDNNSFDKTKLQDICADPSKKKKLS